MPDPVICYDQAVGSDVNVITAVSLMGDQTAYSTDVIYLLRPTRDATAITPTMRLDGLGALGIYDSLSSSLPPGFIRTGRQYFLRYTPNFGGIWNVFSPVPLPKSASDVARAGQLAQSSAAQGLRALYRELNPAPQSLAQIYFNPMASQSDANALLCAHGTLNPNTVASYDPLTYVSSGGGYGLADLGAGAGMWSDSNHRYPGPGMLNIIAAANHVGVLNGQLPAMTDLRNIRVTIQLQAINLRLPPGVRIGLHFQSNDSAAGGNGREINYLYIGSMIDDLLGSGGWGIDWPHNGVTIADSGIKTFVADFAPNDAFFLCLGGSFTRMQDGSYGVAPVERAMRGTFRNMIVIALYPQEDEIVNTLQIERISGQIRFHSFAIESP